MSDSFLFGAGFHKLESVITARERVQSIRASNIANANTPNYKADTRSFDDVMRSMSKGNDHSVQTLRTQPGHMDIGDDSTHISLFTKHSASNRADGNTVKIQDEMVQMAQNQMMHDYTVRIIGKRLAGLRNAIKEGR